MTRQAWVVELDRLRGLYTARVDEWTLDEEIEWSRKLLRAEFGVRGVREYEKRLRALRKSVEWGVARLEGVAAVELEKNVWNGVLMDLRGRRGTVMRRLTQI